MLPGASPKTVTEPDPGVAVNLDQMTREFIKLLKMSLELLKLILNRKLSTGNGTDEERIAGINMYDPGEAIISDSGYTLRA